LVFALALFSGATLAANFPVTNTNDTGPGSLRDAITQANANPGPDLISFAIPGAGPHVIAPLSPLPALTDQSGVTIDGLTQTGSDTGPNPPATLLLQVVLDGQSAGNAHGLYVRSSDNVIRGLNIRNFAQDGVRIEGVAQWDISGNVVELCFIGTDEGGGLAQPNGWNQQQLWAGVNIIVTPADPGLLHGNVVDRCLISGNFGEGVSIANCPPGDVYENWVTGNYIGTDVGGMAPLGNLHEGVAITEGAHDNEVRQNLISANGYGGVAIVGYAELGISTDRNHVVENTIGLAVDQTTPLGNAHNGVTIGTYGNGYHGGYANDNDIVANLIAYNGRNGVLIWEYGANSANADRNNINTNAIYENTLLGIDLGEDGVTPNDPGDPDDGPNQELNFPGITLAVENAGVTTIEGSLDIDSDPTLAVVEVYRARRDPSGYGEGETFLGAATPDGTGHWQCTVTGLVVGDEVTATVTDMNRNTSEFAACRAVTASSGIAQGGTGRDGRGSALRIFPNPFTALATIAYDRGERGPVRIVVYDARGRRLRILARDPRPSASGAGAVTWDGRDDRGHPLPSGIYLVAREGAVGSRIVRKVVLNP
jgi:flagellar hook assembly protein FlgD